MNDTADDPDSQNQSFPVTVLLCVAYSVVFIVGVTGNCLVVTVVYRSPRMRSPTNLFITNLACADLLVNVICIPFTLISSVMGGVCSSVTFVINRSETPLVEYRLL